MVYKMSENFEKAQDDILDFLFCPTTSQKSKLIQFAVTKLRKSAALHLKNCKCCLFNTD